MSTNLNKDLITDMINKLDQEYDLNSRLGRYVSASPELIEFASQNGIPDSTDAARALFISDFIVTSSEVPPGTTDDERRINIIDCFIDALTYRTDETDKIMRNFYLAYNLAIAMRRNDSFLSGRGVQEDTRAILLIDSLIMPYINYMKDLYASDSCYFEVGILSAALLNKFPKTQIESLNKKMTFDGDDLFANIFEMTTQFVKLHNAGTNETVVLPNMDTAQILYINSSRDLPLISTWKTKLASNDETVKSIKSLLKFLDNSDKDIPLVYLRGELKGTEENIILIRNPNVEGKPLCLLKTGADEINVTEMMTLLETRSHLDKNWINIENVTKGVYDIAFEELEEIQTREIEEKQEVQVEVSEKPEKKSGGIFGKLKGIFGGGGKPKSPKTRTETKIKKKKVKEKVKKKVEKKTKLAYHIPPYLSQAIGVHGLSDLRLYEIFDTIREAEYMVTGALESSFADNKTTFLTSEDEENTNQLAQTLDGLDSVIEKVIDFYFKNNPQILPTEILFLSKDDKRSLICMNGDKDRIVGTIARTYEKDITQWQHTEQVQELVQRRTLHMRTNQLLSARVHTPFDSATSRIYGDQLKSDAKFISLDHAILPFDNE